MSAWEAMNFLESQIFELFAVKSQIFELFAVKSQIFKQGLGVSASLRFTIHHP